MADDQQEENFDFTQITKEGEIKCKSSRDYTGKGIAKYANNEIYDGEYIDGVNIIVKLEKKW